MILLRQYKRYSIYLISFFKLHKLFPAFIFTISIRSLINNLFGVKIFNPCGSLLSYHLLVIACQMNLQILLHQLILHFQTSYHNYTVQKLNY